MARARSERSRSKPSPIDELTQNIEQLQALLPKIEDLGRDGFPYLEGAKSRIELQLRECIKRAFGDKSPEYQAHRQLKLAIGSTPEHAKSVAIMNQLIATLEERKLELQGLKPSAPEEVPAPVSSPAPLPELTLVPPPAPPTKKTDPPPTAPGAMPTPSAMAPEAPSTTPAQSTAPMPAPVQPVAPPPPVQQVDTAQVAVSKPKPQSIAPEQVSSLFRPHETGSVPPLVMPPPLPVNPPVAAVMAQPADTTWTSPTGKAPGHSTTQEVRLQSQPTTVQQPSAPSPAQQISNEPTHSATQEIPVPPQPVQSNPALQMPAISPHEAAPQVDNHLELCRRLCQRFHPIARQLRLRGEYRPTVAIEDEIDVQDLLHALLRVQFDDIGTDEWTPSYSHDAPRTTYLLNHDRIAVIVKKTRAGLTVKDLAEQLRLDIEHYRTRDQCTALFCFVYDPEGRIGNPRGLEHDLSTVTDSFTVDLLVAPK